MYCSYSIHIYSMRSKHALQSCHPIRVAIVYIFINKFRLLHFQLKFFNKIYTNRILRHFFFSSFIRILLFLCGSFCFSYFHLFITILVDVYIYKYYVLHQFWLFNWSMFLVLFCWYDVFVLFEWRMFCTTKTK